MKDVNWWLMALAFLLGLLLTFAMMIRRVTREVPVTHTVSAGVHGGVDADGIKADLGKVAGAVTAAGAAAAGGAAAKLSGAAEKVGETIEHVGEKVGEKVGEVAGKVGEKVGDAADKVGEKVGSILEKDPYGPGSVRLAGGGSAAPSGYTIKGNEDSMLYHTTESPWYKQTVAEVWFADEETARKAGFTRWDAGKAGAATLVASIAEVAAGPFGKGSAAPGSDGSGPAGWLIKGNADSMLYHPPDSPAYNETIAEVWFFDEETAKAAGFDKWDKNFR